MYQDIEKGQKYDEFDEFDADTGKLTIVPRSENAPPLEKSSSSVRIFRGHKTMSQSIFAEVLCVSVENNRLVVRDGQAIKVFEFSSIGACNQVGRDIIPRNLDPENVCISGDGLTIAISSLQDGFQDGEKYVQSTVYQFNEEDQRDWQKLGDNIEIPIKCEAAATASVANFQSVISLDGSAVAFGFSFTNGEECSLVCKAPTDDNSAWKSCTNKEDLHYYEGGPPISLSRSGGMLFTTAKSKEFKHLTTQKRRLCCGGSKKLYVEDRLPEMIDFSSRGWATDYAVAVAGLCFFISSLDYREEYRHFIWMIAGTGFAHLFGGLAHHLFPNRASDGEGQVGFYVNMALGYSGNCLGYGFGWGLGSTWQILSIANIVYIVITCVIASLLMKRTTQKIDKTPEGKLFIPDRAFLFGEILVFLGHMISSVMYLLSEGGTDASVFTWVAVAVNMLGWSMVYMIGVVGYYFLPHIVDPAMMQVLFHCFMLIFLWAIHMIATSSD